MGLIYGVTTLKFNSKPIGYIDEDSIDWGGDDMQIVNVWAAQKRGAPIETIVTNEGTDVLTFNIIDLKPENLVDVIGGSKDESGKWKYPRTKTVKEGPAEIVTADGTTIAISKAKLVSQIRGKLDYSGVPLKVKCTLTVVLPDDETTDPIVITSPAS